MSYSVNLDKVVYDKELMAQTRILAAELVQNPYLSVSDYFLGLSDRDIEDLLEISENDEDRRYGDLILIVEMLTRAEGIDIDEEDDEKYVAMLTDRMKAFFSFAALESLSRKGLVKIHRENMSFGDEYMDKTIAEAIKP
jgi:hypothetical protein